MTKIQHHFKHNVVAYLALFVALGGTSYAAIAIPRNSVGTTQLRNGAVTPNKLNGSQIGGTIRAWAYVDANGKVLASHGLRSGAARGQRAIYGFALTDQKITNRCAATAAIAGTTTEAPAAGSANALLVLIPHPPGVTVRTLSAVGQPTNLPFVVEVLC